MKKFNFKEAYARAMVKNFVPQFTVRYNVKSDSRIQVVSGVTSIFPVTDGILLYTRDGKNHYIEACEMMDGISIEFTDSENFAQYMAQPNEYSVYDHGVESDWL